MGNDGLGRSHEKSWRNGDAVSRLDCLDGHSLVCKAGIQLGRNTLWGWRLLTPVGDKGHLGFGNEMGL